MLLKTHAPDEHGPTKDEQVPPRVRQEKRANKTSHVMRKNKALGYPSLTRLDLLSQVNILTVEEGSLDGGRPLIEVKLLCVGYTNTQEYGEIVSADNVCHQCIRSNETVLWIS